VIVLSEAHLERLLRESIEEYHYLARPHQGLDDETPVPTETPPDIGGSTRLVAIPRLGGIHHGHVRVTA